MKNEIICFVLIALCVTFSSAQWTPDPFCPYPSDEVTKYPYYGNCSVWWECYQGAKYVMECDQGLEYNDRLQQCDTPSIARCNPYAPTTSNPHQPTRTSATDSPIGPGPVCPYPSDVATYYPEPSNCRMFWECYEGKAYLSQCNNGLWWHQDIENCDRPGTYCTDTQTTPPPPTCSGASSTPVFYPAEGDCTRYYECSNGKLVLNNCPPGLWWHQSIVQCDYPATYCTWGGEVTTQPNQPSCRGIGSTPVFYPYEGDCSRYWECVNEGLFLNDCPQGLWWDQARKECAYPGTYCTYSGGNITCPSQNNVPVYFPFIGDCARYWECYKGEKYEGLCPSELWWHQQVGRCDTPGTYCRY